MDSLDFLKFLKECIDNNDASAILYELSREEMETDSKYASALKAVKKILGDQMPAMIEDGFKEVMQDENDHCVKFQLYASNCEGIKLGTADS